MTSYPPPQIAHGIPDPRDPDEPRDPRPVDPDPSPRDPPTGPSDEPLLKAPLQAAQIRIASALDSV
jgi:hypothetical protein